MGQPTQRVKIALRGQKQAVVERQAFASSDFRFNASDHENAIRAAGMPVRPGVSEPSARTGNAAFSLPGVERDNRNIVLDSQNFLIARHFSIGS
ncbi:MAG: hypothetical protein Kow0059_03410 [Candidatus Sumerlaeia bacterium]